MPPVIAPPAPFPNVPQPCEGYQLAMPNSPAAAKIVRDFVVTLLRTGAHSGLAEDARLCVSEVVANVYCHTSSQLVRVEVMVDRDQVAIHVTDDGPGPPAGTAGSSRRRRGTGPARRRRPGHQLGEQHATGGRAANQHGLVRPHPPRPGRGAGRRP